MFPACGRFTAAGASEISGNARISLAPWIMLLCGTGVIFFIENAAQKVYHSLFLPV
jgi:hypothetical protein